MVHTGRHHREEEGGGEIPGNGPNEDILRQACPAEKPHDPPGGVAEQRHDEDDIGNHAEEHRDQRRKDHIDRLGHSGTDRLFHRGDQKRARNDGQYAAFSAAKNRIQRNLAVVQPHDGRDLVDAVQRCDHAKHAAQDGRPSETLGCAVSCPCGQVAHHGGVDQREDLIKQRPDIAVCVVRYRLGYE